MDPTALQRLSHSVIVSTLIVSATGCHKDLKGDARTFELALAAGPKLDPQLKDTVSARQVRLRNALSGLCPHRREALLAAAMAGTRLFRDDGTREQFIGGAVVDLIERNQWDSVRQVLSRVPLSEIRADALELQVAQRGIARLQVFIDAARLSRDDNVKDQLSGMLRRAIPHRNLPDRWFLASIEEDLRDPDSFRVNPLYGWGRLNEVAGPLLLPKDQNEPGPQPPG